MTLDTSVRTAMLAAMPKLRAFAISLCRNGDHAEDLVQDTLLRACANIISFTPGTNMLAWLCTILKNHFLSQCRSRRGWSEEIDDHADSIASKPMQVIYAEYNELKAALAKLGPTQREVIVMIGAWGFSYDEAAKICGCPTGTIKSRVNRARAELAQLLSIEGPQDFEEDPIIAAAIAGGRVRRCERNNSMVDDGARLLSSGQGLRLVRAPAVVNGDQDGKANSSRHHCDLPRPLAAALNSRR
jgi:RNA polymerase sigma-70 factor (ECF subfamily)